MINDAVDYIRREVRNHLGVDDSEVLVDNVHIIKEPDNANGVYISLVNVEEETALKNTSHHIRQNNQVHYKEPPVFLNLYLLFSFEFQNYSASLLRLSQTIELFQSKRSFSAENEAPANPFPPTLERLIFDFCNLNFEQLNHLWGVQGGAYFPSVLYKVRLVRVQRDESVEGPEITTIQVDTSVL